MTTKPTAILRRYNGKTGRQEFTRETVTPVDLQIKGIPSVWPFYRMRKLDNGKHIIKVYSTLDDFDAKAPLYIFTLTPINA